MGTITSVEQLAYNATDGATFGNVTSQPISFYGITPVAIYTSVPAASTYATYTQSTATASTVGFASVTDMSSLILAVSTMNAAGRRIGLWT